MPSDAAKKAKTWVMKCCSVGESLFQSVVSAERWISSAVQKDNSAFLYVLQMLSCWMEKDKTWDMKCCSVGESLFQSVVSAERWISSAVQKDGMATHASDWGDHLNIRRRRGKDDVCWGGCVGAQRNSRTIPTVENLRGWSFSFRPEPLCVKL
jgi:hypothetical protein